MQSYDAPVFHAWREQTLTTWRRYTEHPFVRGLGDDSLPEPAFMAYLAQDYVFLLHFSRAWALAVVKAETVSQMRSAAATVNALINEEIQLHVTLCAQHGIDEKQLQHTVEAPENLAYTRYVIDAGLSGDLLDLLATLAPCVFGYHDIACALANHGKVRPLYRQWIDTYHDESYRAVCLAVAALIEEVSCAKLGAHAEANPRWASLRQRFETATMLEADFWQMGLRLGQV